MTQYSTILPRPLTNASILEWESTAIEPLEQSPELPGLSLVMPIYNSGQYLEKTIRSILCNCLEGIQIIVVDGGSNDQTHEIVSNYIDYIDVFISEPDRGQSNALNKGFSHAKNKVLGWLNGDDLLLPGSLTKVRKAFLREKTQVVVGNAFMTEADLTPIRHFKFNKKRLKYETLIDYAFNHLIQPSVFFSAEALRSIGGEVNESLHYSMDAELFLKLSKRYNFIHLEEDIAYSVYHADCKTRGKRAESICELAMVQSRLGEHNAAKKTLQILIDLYNQQKEELELSTIKILNNKIDENAAQICKLLEAK